jgi:hypothetical protein
LKTCKNLSFFRLTTSWQGVCLPCETSA